MSGVGIVRGVRDQFSEGGIVVENAIGFWIHRVYQASRNEMFRAFREHGEEITPEQWAVLIRLWERDGRTQGDLSEATFRDSPTMSRIVDGMEERGLLHRRPDEQDRRVRWIHLTKKGRELEKKLVPVVERIVGQMVAGIDERALLTTRTTLRRMFANLAT
jgi:MarR family transcriptional regulator, organic hydroperoxide resistance regulator